MEEIIRVRKKFNEKIDNLVNNINELENLINKKNIKKEIKPLLKEMRSRDSIIQLYTFLETSVKEVIYQCYQNYKSIIVDEEFLKKFLMSILEKGYVRENLAQKIEGLSIRIEKDVLTSSNNMKFSIISNQFLRYNFDIKRFSKLLEENSKLKEIVKNLNDIQVVPIKSSNDNFRIGEYLDYIVVLRNEISHSSASIQLNREQLEKYCEFLKEFLIVIEKFIINELRRKYYKNEKEDKIEVIEVLYENNIKNKEFTSSLKIKSKKENIDLKKLIIKEIIKDKEENYYNIDIIKLENITEEEISEIILGEQLVKISTECIMKKGKKYEILIDNMDEIKNKEIKIKFN